MIVFQVFDSCDLASVVIVLLAGRPMVGKSHQDAQALIIDGELGDKRYAVLGDVFSCADLLELRILWIGRTDVYSLAHSHTSAAPALGFSQIRHVVI